MPAPKFPVVVAAVRQHDYTKVVCKSIQIVEQYRWRVGGEQAYPSPPLTLCNMLPSKHFPSLSAGSAARLFNVQLVVGLYLQPCSRDHRRSPPIVALLDAIRRYNQKNKNLWGSVNAVDY